MNVKSGVMNWSIYLRPAVAPFNKLQKNAVMVEKWKNLIPKEIGLGLSFHLLVFEGSLMFYLYIFLSFSKATSVLIQCFVNMILECSSCYVHVLRGYFEHLHDSCIIDLDHCKVATILDLGMMSYGYWAAWGMMTTSRRKEQCCSSRVTLSVSKVNKSVLIHVSCGFVSFVGILIQLLCVKFTLVELVMVRELVRRMGTEREAFYHVGSFLVLYWNAPDVICLSSRTLGKLIRLFIQSLLAVYVNSMLVWRLILYYIGHILFLFTETLHSISLIVWLEIICVRTIATLKTTESVQTLAIALVAVVVIIVGLEVTWEEWGVVGHQFRSWLSVNEFMNINSKNLQ